jgi:hypothetical protein
VGSNSRRPFCCFQFPAKQLEVTVDLFVAFSACQTVGSNSRNFCCFQCPQTVGSNSRPFSCFQCPAKQWEVTVDPFVAFSALPNSGKQQSTLLLLSVPCQTVGSNSQRFCCLQCPAKATLFLLSVPCQTVGSYTFDLFCCFQCPVKQLEATVDPVSSPSNMPMRPSPSAHPSKITNFLYARENI